MTNNEKEIVKQEIQELYKKLRNIALSLKQKEDTLQRYIEERDNKQNELKSLNSAEEKTLLQVELHKLKTANIRNQMAIKNINEEIYNLEHFSENPREIKENYEDVQKQIVDLRDKKLILESEISRGDREISRIENKLEGVLLGKSEANETQREINDLNHAIDSLKKDIETENIRNKPRILDIQETIAMKEEELKKYD